MNTIRCCIALALLGLAINVRAQDNLIEVTSTSDARSLPDACTLIAALETALRNLPRQGCTTGRADVRDVVRLPPDSTITIGTGIAVIDSIVQFTGLTGAPLAIEGRGATVQRSPALTPCSRGLVANEEFRLLKLVSSVGIDVGLRDVTLRGFCGGGPVAGLDSAGAVAVFGVNLSLERVRVLGNTNGGIAVSQTPGLANRLLVRDSLFSGNDVQEGFASAISLTGSPDGQVRIENSTFADNGYYPLATTLLTGNGAVSLRLVAKAEVINSTFVNNQVKEGPAALLARADQIALQGNTFVGNRSTLAGSTYLLEPAFSGVASALISNNLLAWSGTNASGNCAAGAAVTMQFLGANLSTDPTCAGFTPVDSLGLRAVNDYGGPVPTMVPLTGSPAVDASTSCGPADAILANDARGIARPQDGDNDGTFKCDAGAAEFVRNRAPVVSGPSGVVALAGVPFAFTAATGNLISVDDPDARDLPMRVAISADVGLVRFGSETGLQCDAGTGGPNGDPLRRCTGTRAALNHALVGMVYQSTIDANGTADVRVTADDLGNGGDDRVPLSDTLSIETIVAINAPVATLSTATVDFGAVAVGVQAAPRTITLFNTGSQPLILSAINQIGGMPDFSIASTCGVAPPNNVLQQLASCTIAIGFMPSAPGERNAALTVVSNAASSPDLVLLTGTGVGEAIFANSFE